MFQFIYYFIFILFNPHYFSNIEAENDLKLAFKKAYLNKKYDIAIDLFDKYNNKINLIEPELRLDVANAYYKLNNTLQARKNYEMCVNLMDNNQASIALNQLGNLAVSQGDSAKAINLYKTAIEKNNDFDLARYNYELIRKLYRYKSNSTENKEEKQQQKNVAVEKSTEKEEELESYKPKNMSKEKALLLLDDLKSSELKISIDVKNTDEKIEKDW